MSARHDKTLAQQLREAARGNGTIEPPAELADADQQVETPAEMRDVWGHLRKDLPPREPAADVVVPLPDDQPWPAALAPEAYHGLAGQVVRAIEPASEADPVALLLSFLVGFGNLVGRTAHFTAEADRHYANEFVVLVGRTSKGRKGTSWGHIHRLLSRAEEQWAQDRIGSGLSSGEGLIWEVRDPIMKRERVKQRNGPARYEDVEADPGVLDKRLLVIEQEFASVLKRIEQQGNSLSAVLRLAWDGRDCLRSMTKNSPARATGAHVSLVGHISVEEVRRYLNTTEAANGFGNRHLWLCVRRSKSLPDGGRPDQGVLARLAESVGQALTFARRQGEMYRDEQAREIWHAVYGELSEGRPGMAGALLGRAEAHVMRLALLYALLDQSAVIGGRHLTAALAVWQYAEQSVRHIFGAAMGDPLADELLRLIKGSKDGVTRTTMRDHFSRHANPAAVGRALALLLSMQLVRVERQDTGGRRAERWYAVETKQ
jgi:hypothetical protein